MKNRKKIYHTFYIDKQKIRFVLFVGPKDDPETIEKKLISRKIKILVEFYGENMAEWARDLNLNRQSIYHVKQGRRNTPYIRRYIEKKLRQRIWNA